MSVDLATQVGALVGGSLLLFLVTKPRQKDASQINKQEDNIPLKGVKRYSSYHRKKYYAQTSSISVQ
eukprot:scaffold362_cov176-Amphora_coffeaeformis.AAC.27